MSDATILQSTLPPLGAMGQAFPPPVHGDRDDKGSCRACGATRELIDDGLAKTCEMIKGPNRIALIAARDARLRREDELRVMRSHMLSARLHADRLEGDIANKERELAELVASIDSLQEAEFDMASLAELRTTSGGYGT